MLTAADSPVTHPTAQEREAEGRRTQSARRDDEARALRALEALGPAQPWHESLEPMLPPAPGGVGEGSLAVLYSSLGAQDLRMMSVASGPVYLHSARQD